MIKNPLRMWMMLPFAVVFTAYIFYYEIIKNETPPLLNFSPSTNSAVMAFFNQGGIHIAGQLLLLQFMLLGTLILWLEWKS